MKKKNYLWSIATIMIVAMLSVSLSACSSDDDDDNGGASSVVGTWTGAFVDDDCKSDITITFNPGGTGKYAEKFVESGSNYEVDFSASFDYSMSDAKSGRITSVSSSDFHYEGYVTEKTSFEVNGNKMTLYTYEGNISLTRQ